MTLQVPDFSPKIESSDGTPHYLRNSYGMNELVNEFISKNNLYLPRVEYANEGKIAVVDFERHGDSLRSQMVLYVNSAIDKLNIVLGVPLFGQTQTHREDKWSAEGRINGKQVKLEAFVGVSKDSELIPGKIELSSERIDTLPYWFVKGQK